MTLNPEEDAGAIKEEFFGPVQCVSTFESEDEALRLANDTECGLHASLYTKDIPRTIGVVKIFKSGLVGVNVTSPFLALDMPFGGGGKQAETVENWAELS